MVRGGTCTLLSLALLFAGCSSEDAGVAMENAGNSGASGSVANGAGGSTSSGTAGSVMAGGSGSASTHGGASASGAAGASAGLGGVATGGVATGGGATGGASGAAAGGAGGDAQGGSTSGGTAGGTGSPLPPIADYGAMGPFATTTESKTGPNGKYVVYRPATLGQNGFLHSPITFGPGIGDEPDAAKVGGLLKAIASHGYVIVATRLDGAPGAAANNQAMLDGLDWLIQQNGVAGVYQGKLDVKRAVSMGYSVGGTSAVAIADHEAVITTVSIHGHSASSNMHGPLLQTSATGDTVGLPLQKQTFGMSKVPTFLGIIQGGSHAYPMQNNGGAERPAIIAWLRYWVNGDTGGQKYFNGDSCVMCGPPDWTTMYQRKNWPQ